MHFDMKVCGTKVEPFIYLDNSQLKGQEKSFELLNNSKFVYLINKIQVTKGENCCLKIVEGPKLRSHLEIFVYK